MPIRNSGSVQWSRKHDVAILVIDHPAFDLSDPAVRVNLKDALTRAENDASIAAVVLAAARRAARVDADIPALEEPQPAPSPTDLVAQIDSIRKPVICALDGTILGSGLELALAALFRVAAPKSRFGLPQIKLGLIPAAGGTQRLPRLVGMEPAMAMILKGEAVSAKEALTIGLIDAIADGDLVAEAVAFARRILAEKRTVERVRDREEKLASLRADPKTFDAMAAAYRKRARGLSAPLAAIEALRAAFQRPFDEGLEVERAKFDELRRGEQSKALRHVVLAERCAAEVPDLAADVAPRGVASAAVIGAGTMGSGIAMCFANAGIPVTLVEVGAAALKHGLEAIAANYRASAARGATSAADVEKRIGMIRGATDIEAVGTADIVVEAVTEEMAIKKHVFAKLDQLAKADAILASNTSYLDIDALAATIRRPQSVLGMHFFSPAHVMRLLEVVRAARTAPEVLATALDVGRRLGKVPVVVGMCNGFVGNRMLRVRLREAERLLVEGALPQEVDAALVGFGFPMGPFAIGDLAGLDIAWRMRKAQGLKAEIADQLCAAGRFGQKTGKGFYLYEKGARTPRPDPEVERLIVATSARLGIVRRAIAAEEILERLLFPMINEGARILAEGVARRSSDIDVVWIYGFGFPAWRGGPMYYADSLGLAYVCERLTQWVAQSGAREYEPAPLLARLAAEGRGFDSVEEDNL